MLSTDNIIRSIRCGEHHTHPTLEDSLRIQEIVFVHEQGLDLEMVIAGTHDSTHYVLHVLVDGFHEAAACARVTFMPRDRSIKIQRVAVLPEHRGCKHARRLLEYIIAEQGERYQPPFFWLNSQIAATGLYETLGFTACGDVFNEAGKRHIRMQLAWA